MFALLAVMTGSGQNYSIDPSQPVSSADVEITAVNVAFFDNDSIRIVSPDEAKPAMARRRVMSNDITNEGDGGGPANVKLYSYTYPSVDADGNAVRLSSLMAVPTRMVINSFAKPSNLVIGCHVTITSNFECPTEYNRSGGTLSWMTDVGMQIFYARYDIIRQPCCLVILPDYEGYGATKDRAHPYLYQELTARQVTDAVRYGLALYKANIDSGEKFAEFEEGWKSVCVGYSQGGSVSLATHRFIEENGLSSELHFAGSVCGDGPYDPLEHLRYYMQDNGTTYDGGNKTQHERETVSMPIVMPLILKGMCDRNPFMRQHKVSDYLSDMFLNIGVINFINAKSQSKKEKQYSTDNINDEFKNYRKHGKNYYYHDDDGKLQIGSYSPSQIQEMLYKEADSNVHGKMEKMLTERAFNYFRSLQQDAEVPAGRGVMEDLHRALASNSLVSGWTPTHRIGFYHSTYDTVVPYANLLSFMRHQDGLGYYFADSSRKRSTAAGVTPSHIVGEDKADVYIIDDDTKKDHVEAGKSFFFFGSPSPDYKLMKWVFEGKSDTPSASASHVVGTVNLQNNGSDIKAEALIDLDARSVVIGNGQNACIPQYTSGTVTVPGEVIVDGIACSVNVGQLAFRLCNSLTEVVIGEGVTQIGDYAFVGCASLEKVTLPSTLNRIGGGAFVGLTALKEMTCKATTAPSWGYNDLFAFEGTAEATAVRASERTLFVPRNCAYDYRTTKYHGAIGWEDAFGHISEAVAPTQTLEVATVEDLRNLSNRVSKGDNMGDYTVQLTADIVNDGDTRNQWISWIPIGTAQHPFKGVFDGGGHIIRNVKPAGDEDGTDVGLFGYVEGASIGNLFLQNISMKGTDNVGVVAGKAVNSELHDIFVYDAQSSSGEKYYCAEAANGNAGGLAGTVHNSTIWNCYFYGKVKGTAAVGGIVGATTGIVTVSSCAAAYSVETDSSSGVMGGIVGKAESGTGIMRSYSRATLGGTAATRGAIVGRYTLNSDVDLTGITHCAWLDAEGTLPVADKSGEGHCAESDNLRCSNVADMEGLQLRDCLGEMQWYYFHGDMNDCPIPATLAEQYLAWAGIKDSDGFVYAPVTGGNLAAGGDLQSPTPASYTVIGYKGSAAEITIPDSYKGKAVTAIGNHAFKDCAVTGVVIPDGITAIGEGAFDGCTSLTHLSIGAGVASAYCGWLDGCTQLAHITVAEGNTEYIMQEGILYNAAKNLLIRCSTTYSGTLTVPAAITGIAAGAFANCQNLIWADLRETATAWNVNRQLPTSPFYDSSKYTLFMMNANSTVAAGEPNVVYNDDVYGDAYCKQLLMCDNLGYRSPVKFNAGSVLYDRQFATTFASVKNGDDAENVIMPKAYTVCLPFTPKIAAGKGVKVYSFDKAVTEGDVVTVYFDQAGIKSGYYRMHPNYPYLVLVDGDGTYTMSTDEETQVQIVSDDTGGYITQDGYAFRGTTSGKGYADLLQEQKPFYVLQGNGNWRRMTEDQTSQTILPFRCYFQKEDTPRDADELITAVTDAQDTWPTIELKDLEDNTAVLESYDGLRVNVNYNRVLRAVDNGNGTWSSKAYTVCLPYDLNLTKERDSGRIQVCKLWFVHNPTAEEIAQRQRYEFVFSNTSPELKAGRGYLVIVNEGELNLSANGVFISNKEQEEDVYNWSTHYGRKGIWGGSLRNRSNDECTESLTYTMSNDGDFRRISNTTERERGAWMAAFRAAFFADEYNGRNRYYSVYKKWVNGEDDDNPFLSLPAIFFEGDSDFSGYDDDENVGIKVINLPAMSRPQSCYDLQGRHIQGKPAKGVYIVNGKKRIK